jgi:Uma2 family endonuclease
MPTPTLLEPRVKAPPAIADNDRYEIVNGQRVELPPMSLYAGLVASRLDQRLGPFVDDRRLGIVVAEVLFILDPKSNLRRRPDVAFVSAERWPLDRLIPETGDWEVVPNLAVEVISPSDTWEDVLAKIDEYFQKGVGQMWIVAPVSQKVYMLDSPTSVRVLTAADELDGGPLLPGFRLPLARLFQRQTEAGTPAHA